MAYGFDTLKVRAGYDPKDHNNSVQVPIYQTASFSVDGAEHFDKLRNLSEAGYIYSRIGNPTVTVLEERVAALEGAKGALGVASGMAAISYAILTVAEGGGRILTTHQLYGGTVDAIKKVFPKAGISIDKVDTDSSAEEFDKAIKEDTKAIYVESISNPNAVVADIERLADIAHAHNIPLIVDNTIATPYLLNPIKFGADIVIYSATKALSGHGNVIGGLIVDSGNFDWTNGKFDQFTEKHYTLRDVNDVERSYVEAFGDIAFLGKARMDYLAYFGAVLSPFDAYLILIGLETLSERVKKQVSSAEKIVEYLKSEDKVAWISYPSLEGGHSYELAKKYLPKGAGSTFSFGFKGTTEDIYKFTKSVELFGYQANLGDARSLIINSPRTTHGELTKKELQLAQIEPETIRLSIGLEDPEDLITDLKQSFAKTFNQ